MSPQHFQAILDRSRILNQLLTPPTVVVVGPANAGKSTLTNALMGRAVSLVADLPGTTRDWVGGLVELSATGNSNDAVAVNWLDTPGLRESDDTIEQRAIALAKQQIEHADVLIAMRDPQQPWPDASALPREPDLWVVNKVDADATQGHAAGDSQETPLAISAIQQYGLDRLQAKVVYRLGLRDLDRAEVWAFSPALREACRAGSPGAIDRYCTSRSAHEA